MSTTRRNPNPRNISRKSKELGMIDPNNEVKIKAISSEEYPIPTKRPKCSWLNKEKIKKELSLDIRNWEDALTDFLSS